MLIDFKFGNYKSFLNEAHFSMKPAKRQTGIDYSIQNETIGKKQYKGLCSSVVYGPNASGKTNLIGAMETLRAIILRGNIANADGISSPNIAAYSLEWIPNCFAENQSTIFEIKFTEGDFIFEYSFVANLGGFMDKESARKIEKEKLYINEKLVFDRGDDFTFNISSINMEYSNSGSFDNIKTIIEIAKNGLNDQDLFLCNGFKTTFSKELYSIIYNWFANKFMVIYRSDSVQLMRRFADPKSNTIYIEKTITDAAKMFGITSNALGYQQQSKEDDPVLLSVFSNEKPPVPAEYFESYGTIRFINEFPLVIRALLTGATLVMDEFDASIHPMALMNIINIFHNDEININHAQLIFNTHNPIFLDSTLFRRDEIKFVERDETTNNSVIYSLSDFKTANGVRKGEDYMNNYFISRYGAIKDVDFSKIVKDIINNAKVKKNG